MALQEWTTHILRMRDMRKRQIKDIVEVSSGLIQITQKDSEQILLKSEPKLSYSEDISQYFCDNSLENVTFLHKNWEVFCQQPQVKVTFVNKDGSFWTIIPYNHAKITESKNLLPGLKSLYTTSLA